MKKIITITILMFAISIFCKTSVAQISQGGNPFSFSEQNASHLNPLVPTETMPFVDVAALQQEDLNVDKYKDIPWRFGQNIEVVLNMQNKGVWDILPNGDKLWRYRIYSAGATSINLTFENYHVPPGASLYIYNDDRSQVIGSFTDFNNREDRVFATTLVNGEATNLEYYEPANVSFPGEIVINRVTHGYRGVKEYLAKSFGGSGSCQINVHCPTGTGWEDQIRSACMLVSGGSGFCSGSLVNNTANNGTPYVLTANHCYSDPSTWVFWFNWEAPTCPDPGSSPSYNSMSGALLRAKNAASDFCLVQINSAIPANYNVYFSGWDRSGTPPTSGMGIHHPAGDIKKISPCNAMNTATYSTASCWQTPWTGAACTEGGSSGSPIFDQNKRVVGQLYGGPSACGAADMWDYYGRFDISWTGGGTAATRLSNWLDPSSTGGTTLDGYDPNGAVPPTVNFTANVTTSCTGVIAFTDQSSSAPTSWSWDFGDATTSTLQNPTHTYTANGTYTVSLTATNLIGGNTLTKTSYITINMPSAPSVVGDTICNSGAAILHATGSGILKWYSLQTGGSVLGTGPTFTTPWIGGTTTYWVKDSVAAAQIHGAKADNTGGGANLTNQNRYLIFNCTTPMTLVSVNVYASVTGTRTFELRNSSGTSLATAAVNILSTSGAYTVPLNFSVPVGTDLQLGLSTSSTCNLYRNDAGVVYPYTTPGMFSITNSDAGAQYYYYLYDWVVKGADCVSPRAPVTALVQVCSGIEESDNDGFTIYPNPVHDKIFIESSNISNGKVSVNIYTATGQLIYENIIGISGNQLKTEVNCENWSAGMYYLRILNGDNIYFRKIAVE